MLRSFMINCGKSSCGHGGSVGSGAETQRDRAKVRSRRIFLVAAHPGEGPLTKPTAAVQLAWHPIEQDAKSPRESSSTSYRSSMLVRSLAVGDWRLALFGAHFVDDLQDALAIGAELHAEFRHHAAVVDHEIARPLAAAGFVVKADLRIRQKFAHDVGQFAQADRVAAG